MKIQQNLAEYKFGQNTDFFTVEFQELLRIFWETYRFNSREFLPSLVFILFACKNVAFYTKQDFSAFSFPPPLFDSRVFFSICTIFTFPFKSVILSLLRTITKRARSLARVCGTGMYRFIEHVKFAKFQTEIFAKW